MGRKVSFRCSVMQHRRLLRPFSNSLSMLDFSQLGERGRGHASAISSKCSESFRRLRPAPLLATKLAVLRNGPLSEACSSTFRGALWARLRSTSSCAEKEAVALFEGLRDFLRVFFRTPTRKKSQGIDGSVGRCALRCTQMAKVDLYARG
jgi:hypothetical protein